MNTKYWEEEIETMSRKKLQELQLQAEQREHRQSLSIRSMT